MSLSDVTYVWFKRFIDIVLSFVGLVLTLPVLFLTAALIKLDSKGPVLFTQHRVGLNGKSFKMYKFRTMSVNAESELETMLEKNEMDGPAFKMEHDPRVTRVGRSLRKHCIDELPQLLNVLLGSMSIVGPRPPIVDEVEKYEAWHHLRFKAKPGLTCYWQVENNRKMSFDDWVRLDIAYASNKKISTDIMLILRTIPVVLFGQH